MTTAGRQRRQLLGTIVSDRMTKTRVVRVDRMKKHARYGKRYTASITLKAHDERNEFHTGDQVLIEETRPLSATKRWRVIGRRRGQKSAP